MHSRRLDARDQQRRRACRLRLRPVALDDLRPEFAQRSDGTRERRRHIRLQAFIEMRCQHADALPFD
jgi:hypothetical protein